MPVFLQATNAESGDAGWGPAPGGITEVPLLTGILPAALPNVTLEGGLTWQDVIDTYDMIEISLQHDTGAAVFTVQAGAAVLPVARIVAGVSWPTLGVDADNSDPAGAIFTFGALNTGTATIAMATSTLVVLNLVAYTR